MQYGGGKDLFHEKNESYHLTKSQKRYRFLKMFFDFLAATGGILLLLPVFLLIAVAIKLDDGGPVFFHQIRLGMHQKAFTMYKFRTMRVDTPPEVPTCELHDPERYITRVGHFLRRTSLDELPQLFNIVLGAKLSLIGPRPALRNEKELLRLREGTGVDELRPGISGWAQIHGRDELTIQEKARLDAEYARNFGLGIDIRCFFGTFAAVLLQRGVAEGGKRREKQS